jgi:YVTN family beta-propeller protein
MYGIRAIVGVFLLTLLFLPPPGVGALVDDEEPFVMTTVQVGVGPWAVGVDHDTSRVYIGNYYKDTISVIDTSTHQVVATVWARRPASITVDRETGRAYVGAAGQVVVIDGPSSEVIARVPLGTRQSLVTDVELNPGMGRVYALLDQPGGAPDSVFAIDAETAVVEGELEPGSQLSDLTVDQLHNDLLLVDPQGSRVSVVDCDCQVVVESIQVGVQGSDSVLCPRTGRLYVSGYGGIAVLDMESRELLDTLDLNGLLAIDPARSRLYVLGQTSLTAVNALSHEIVGQVSIRPYASGLLVNPFSGRVYVASRWSNRITVIDGDTLDVVAELPKRTHLGSPSTIPMGLDPWTERIYVPNFGCHAVTVVQDVTGRVPPPVTAQYP